MQTQAGVLERIVDAGIIPVVRVTNRDVALKVADALIEGGVRTVEITFSVPGAPGAIELLRGRYPQMLIGAGTVLDEASAAAAVAAGAQYILSPGTVDAVVHTAHRHGLPAVPGVATPTEVIRAMEMGADILKLFPASALGPEYLKALRPVFPTARWCPTGGVSIDNLHEWFGAGATVVGVGGPLLRDVEKTGDYAALAARARAFVERLREVRA